ncbi:ribosomal protein S18-alanine N-acetyltransferase [Candidatus Bodocaedibacter vickermanii]
MYGRQTSPTPKYMFNIQRLDISHIARCLDILTSSFDSPWTELNTVFENPANRVCGVFIEDVVVGFIVVSIILDECEILMCAVDPEHHKQGVATALIEHVLNDIKDLEIGVIFLEVDIHNVAAQGLYKKFGFQTVGQRKHYYHQPDGSYHDAVIMRLSI